MAATQPPRRRIKKATALSVCSAFFDAMRGDERVTLFVAGWFECDHADAERIAREIAVVTGWQVPPAHPLSAGRPGTE